MKQQLSHSFELILDCGVGKCTTKSGRLVKGKIRPVRDLHKIPRTRAGRNCKCTTTAKSPIMAALGRTEKLSLLSLSAACIGIIANTFQGDGEPLIASLAFSGLAFAFTFCLIRWLGNAFMAAGLKGKDLSKARKPEM